MSVSHFCTNVPKKPIIPDYSQPRGGRVPLELWFLKPSKTIKKLFKILRKPLSGLLILLLPLLVREGGRETVERALRFFPRQLGALGGDAARHGRRHRRPRPLQDPMSRAGECPVHPPERLVEARNERSCMLPTKFRPGGRDQRGYVRRASRRRCPCLSPHPE